MFIEQDSHLCKAPNLCAPVCSHCWQHLSYILASVRENFCFSFPPSHCIFHDFPGLLLLLCARDKRLANVWILLAVGALQCQEDFWARGKKKRSSKKSHPAGTLSQNACLFSRQTGLGRNRCFHPKADVEMLLSQGGNVVGFIINQQPPSDSFP